MSNLWKALRDVSRDVDPTIGFDPPMRGSEGDAEAPASTVSGPANASPTRPQDSAMAPATRPASPGQPAPRPRPSAGPGTSGAPRASGSASAQGGAGGGQHRPAAGSSSGQPKPRLAPLQSPLRRTALANALQFDKPATGGNGAPAGNGRSWAIDTVTPDSGPAPSTTPDTVDAPPLEVQPPISALHPVDAPRPVDRPRPVPMAIGPGSAPPLPAPPFATPQAAPPLSVRPRLSATTDFPPANGLARPTPGSAPGQGPRPIGVARPVTGPVGPVVSSGVAVPSGVADVRRPYGPVSAGVSAMGGSHWQPGDDDVVPTDGRKAASRLRLRDRLPW